MELVKNQEKEFEEKFEKRVQYFMGEVDSCIKEQVGICRPEDAEDSVKVIGLNTATTIILKELLAVQMANFELHSEALEEMTKEITTLKAQIKELKNDK